MLCEEHDLLADDHRLSAFRPTSGQGWNRVGEKTQSSIIMDTDEWKLIEDIKAADQKKHHACWSRYLYISYVRVP